MYSTILPKYHYDCMNMKSCLTNALKMKVYKSMRGLVAFLKAQAEAEKAARQVLVRFPNPLLGSWGT